MNNLVKNSCKRLFILTLILILVFSVFNIPVLADDDRPDLIINYLDFPEEVNEGEEANFTIKVKNIVSEGDGKNISSGTTISVALKVNDIVVETESISSGLDIGESKYLNISWDAEFSDSTPHEISVVVDYLDTIFESDENNNNQDGFIDIVEKETELEITNVETPDIFVINETVNILATVRNNGADTTRDIYAKFNSSKEDEIETVVKTDVLERDEEAVFSLNWTPSEYGSQKIYVDIVYRGKSHDDEKISIIVLAESFEWWNENWHYRYFLTVDGKGNVSKTFNFTALLEEIGVFSQNFENDNIRIIEYDYDGFVAGEMLNYSFIENSSFNEITNAKGTLLWNIPKNSDEKYYCIYFDVSINPGTRTSIVEVFNMSESGNADVTYGGYVEGWCVQILEPENNSFYFINGTLDLLSSTSAKAEDVTAFIHLSENISHNFTVYLTDIENKTSWSYDGIDFDVAGNWTILLYAKDSTDYNRATVEHTIYVGQTDLEMMNISYSTDWQPTSPMIYLEDTVEITAEIVSHLGTIQDVNVSLFIFDEDDLEIYNETVTTTIYKDEINNVSFEWFADTLGDITFEIIIDPDNLIDELDESNNEISDEETVYQWPDLTITDITWTSNIITQYDDIEFSVTVENVEGGDADDYEIKLFAEPAENNLMSYTYDEASVIFNLSAGSEKTIKMTWESANYGRWLIGAKIFVGDDKQDLNKDNNSFLSDYILTVRSVETNRPVFKNVQVDPDVQEQGGIVEFSATITDDSGLDEVTLEVIDPDDEVYRFDMIRAKETYFVYNFENTDLIGRYSYSIEAIDISLNRNNRTRSGNFEIIPDDTNPIISYFGAEPRVQLKGENVSHICIATDNAAILVVEVIITAPDGTIFDKIMDEDTDGKYVYKDIYNSVGGYEYYVIVRDKAGNKAISQDKYFWITTDLEDADSDGMPTWWENRYHFDPEDPDDAKEDFDGDGLTNKVEYEAGTNPQKDIKLENLAYRVRSNVGYLTLSIIAFLVIIFMSLDAKRRR